MDPGDSAWEEGGRKMKTSMVGVVSVVILMVVACVGFGTEQAGGDQSDNRAWTLEKWIPEYPNDEVATSAAGDIQLASADQEFVPEDNWSGTDWQTRGPIETGAIPGAAVEESWMKDYGND
jgi:hypothetical protein